MTEHDFTKALNLVCLGLSLALEEDDAIKSEITLTLNDVDYKLTFEKLGDSNED